MHFLTEDDIRIRCPKPGGTLSLAANERLTPSAAEFAAHMRVTVVQGIPPSAAPQPSPAALPASGGARAAGIEYPESMTRLDASTVVPKSHPRIMLRGKLDTLLAATVLTQTQFDPKNKLSPFLKDCLGELADWVLCVLSAEVSGNACTPASLGGMDAATLCAVSQDPGKYLGLEPFVPGVGMGANAALINWLRALAREAEVAAAQSGLDRADIAASLNRLSSAAYVLVLLTLAAENGVDVTKIRRG